MEWLTRNATGQPDTGTGRFQQRSNERNKQQNIIKPDQGRQVQPVARYFRPTDRQDD